MDRRAAAAAGEAYGRLWTEAAVAATEGVEFRTWLCGCTPPPGLSSEAAEAWRRACNRALAAAVHARWGPERPVDHLKPDIQVVLRREPDRVEIDAAPLFVAGRYRKLQRGLSQSPFHCKPCRGRGRVRGRRIGPCPDCGGRGRLVERAVADFLPPLLREAAAAETATFAGCGREDIDVLMLGEGRPFVVAIEQPRRRSLDLAALGRAADAAADGAVEHRDLAYTDREGMKRITSTHPAKRYRARVETEGGIAPEEARRVEDALTGVRIAQRTPERVSGRRADLVRERTVYEARMERHEDGTADLLVRTEGGTYIKELVSGDEGRTQPSVASVLGRRARCTELDVLAVEIAERTEPSAIS